MNAEMIAAIVLGVIVLGACGAVGDIITPDAAPPPDASPDAAPAPDACIPEIRIVLDFKIINGQGPLTVLLQRQNTLSVTMHEWLMHHGVVNDALTTAAAGAFVVGFSGEDGEFLDREIRPLLTTARSFRGSAFALFDRQPWESSLTFETRLSSADPGLDLIVSCSGPIEIEASSYWPALADSQLKCEISFTDLRVPPTRYTVGGHGPLRLAVTRCP